MTELAAGVHRSGTKPSAAATADWARSRLANPISSPGSARAGATSLAVATCRASIAPIACSRTMPSASASTSPWGAAITVTGAIDREVSVQEGEQAPLVPSASPRRADQRAGDFDLRPCPGNQPELAILDHRGSLRMTSLVTEVRAGQHGRVEVGDHRRSRSAASSPSTTGPIPAADAMTRRRLAGLTVADDAACRTPMAAARALSRARRSPRSASTAASRISVPQRGSMMSARICTARRSSGASSAAKLSRR